MDDDEYQRMVDYENEIYNLNHGEEEQNELERDSLADAENETPDIDEEENTATADFSDPRNSKNTKFMNDDKGIESPDKGSLELSEDERNQIYAQLYHFNSTLPKATSNFVHTDRSNLTNPRKKGTVSSSSNKENAGYSNGITYELDLDNLPSPPPGPTPPVVETSTVDEDGDFAVLSPPELN